MNKKNVRQGTKIACTRTRLGKLKSDIKTNPGLYLMIVPVLLFYIVFFYFPMYGVNIAFRDYTPALGILDSPWVGFKHFKSFFNDIYFLRLIRNTLRISVTNLLFGFPAPILLALMINEVKRKGFAKLVQTITYMPHFISMVVICGMIKQFTTDTGIVTQFFSLFGFKPQTMLTNQDLFVPIYVISGIWQTVGWSSIVYLAALCSVDEQLYEAASIDGAGKLRQMIHVTLPGIIPTIAIMLIMAIGSMLNVGYEKIILLYNPGIYETSDVISSYVYRKGLLEFGWSYSTAVGLFNTVVNLLLLIISNNVSKKVSGTALW